VIDVSEGVLGVTKGNGRCHVGCRAGQDSGFRIQECFGVDGGSQGWTREAVQRPNGSMALSITAVRLHLIAYTLAKTPLSPGTWRGVHDQPITPSDEPPSVSSLEAAVLDGREVCKTVKLTIVVVAGTSI
jgi:hypothetical protein